MTVATGYEPHPLAELVPSMSEAEYLALVEDIDAHGLADAIVLHEGKILDGRHRYRACCDAEVPPRFTVFEGRSPVEFVVSKNLKRRHLSVSQLTAVAVGFLPALEAEAKQRQVRAGQEHGRGMNSSVSTDTELPPPRRAGQPSRAAEQAGALVGVSGVSVARAKRVQREDPEMFEQVKAGALTVSGAHTAIRERAATTNDEVATSPPLEITERQRQISDAARRRLAKAMSTLDGLRLGLDGFPVARAKTCTSEASAWP